MPSDNKKLGLIAGNGTFPLLVLDAARAQGFDVVVVAIREEASAEIEDRGAASVHWLIPGFGLIANLVCMGFYIAGPVFGLGTFKEPLLALGISAVWGIYGAIYFIRSSQKKGKAVLLTSKTSV